jgi:predicted kinase
MADERPNEAVILVGLQGSGKSTFCRERFWDTHVRINLDMLRTRHRESLLFQTCLAAQASFVVDNTNPRRADRARYIPFARSAGFRVIGYYLQSKLEECKQRNCQRPTHRVVPLSGLLGTYKALELPSRDEGFDELHFVRTIDNGFVVEEWSDEIRRT